MDRATSSPASTGVSTTPSRFEKLAAQIAAATLPPAIEVNVIEDCTVDGSAHRNSSPRCSGSGSTAGTSTPAASPSSGNR